MATVPVRVLITQFNELVMPMLDEARKLCHSSAISQRMRDLLLPRLMSGESIPNPNRGIDE